jgi:hypothetical protein
MIERMFPHASDEEIVDLVGQMHGIGNASLRLLLAGVVELDQRESWRADGAHSMAMWLEMRHGVSSATARQWLRVARGLVFCPEIAATFEAGHLSWDQLVAAVELVAFGGGDDPFVARDAVGRSAAELDRLAREARRVRLDESESRHQRRYLRLRWDRAGMLHVHGRLSDAEGKLVEAALARLADQQPSDPDGVPVFRPLDERRADAFVHACSAQIGADADPDRATVVVHVDAHALLSGNDSVDLASLELGPLVSMAPAHRLICDGRCQVVVDDLFGRTVEIAKTKHAVPRWLRRRVLHRDGGCRWPGCGRTALLHAHHIRWWTRDRGPTEEGNLCALGPFHHRLVHEGGWEIEGDPLGRLRFTGPSGRVVESGPPGLRDDVRDGLGLRWAGDPPVPAA